MSKASPLNPTTVLTSAVPFLAYDEYKKQKKAERDIRTAMDQQKDEMRRQEDEFNRRRESEVESANRLASRRASIAKKSNRPPDRSGTILTSPLGLPAGGVGPGKTLLGS